MFKIFLSIACSKVKHVFAIQYVHVYCNQICHPHVSRRWSSQSQRRLPWLLQVRSSWRAFSLGQGLPSLQPIRIVMFTVSNYGSCLSSGHLFMFTMCSLFLVNLVIFACLCYRRTQHRPRWDRTSGCTIGAKII